MPTAGQDGCWFLAKQTRKYHQGCLLYIHVNNIKDTRKIPPPSSCSYPPHTRLSQAHTGQGWACAWGCGQGPRQVHLQHEGMGWQKGRCGEFLEYSGKRLLVSSKTHCSFCVYLATEGILRYLRVFTPSQPWQAKGNTWVVDCSAVKKSMSTTEKQVCILLWPHSVLRGLRLTHTASVGATLMPVSSCHRRTGEETGRKAVSQAHYMKGWSIGWICRDR